MAFSSNWGGVSTRGGWGSVGARDPERRTMEVRRVQGIHTQQHEGRESGVKKTWERRNGVSETIRPGYGLGQTATVADDLGYGEV